MAYFGGNAAYVDDGTYNDHDRSDYDYENDDTVDDDAVDENYVENAMMAPVEKSARKSTKGRQLKRWDCKSWSARWPCCC